VIKYLGSKKALLPELVAVIEALRPAGPVLDLFSGTSRVGHALKARGHRVFANDHATYAQVLARCYVQADAERHAAAAERLLAELSALPGRPGFFTAHYCEQARFFQPQNGARVDAIRAAIAEKGLEPELEAVLLTSLMEAADRVDSTTGVQMAYLKSWAPRAFKPLELRLPALLPRAAAGAGQAHGLEADAAAALLEGDVAYLDPPYNQHKYLGNYHIWETLVRADAPEVYGVARKRVDTRDRHSPFNARRGARDALARLALDLKVRHLVVSFNDEGHVSRAELEALLAPRGEVLVLARGGRRYVGAQIGVYSPQGQKVGEVSHLRNTELIFIATPDPAAAARLRALGAAPAGESG